MLEIFTRSPSTILNLQVSREVLQIGLLINLHFCYDMLTKHFITDTSLQNKIVEIISVHSLLGYNIHSAAKINY